MWYVCLFLLIVQIDRNHFGLANINFQTVYVSAIDGAWMSWSAYGPCSVTCGPGNKTRTRSCTNPAPIFSGEECPPGGDSESVDCNRTACPPSNTLVIPAQFHSVWRFAQPNEEATRHKYKSCSLFSVDGSWSEWVCQSGSAPPCAFMETKSRACDNPAPAYGGASCQGSADWVCSRKTLLYCI